LVATPRNRMACQFQDPISVVATKSKMEPTWNEARPDAKQRQQSRTEGLHGGQGLEAKKSRLPVEGKEYS
jgi:hypothetical protein